jgi:hypothetical protein
LKCKSNKYKCKTIEKIQIAYKKLQIISMKGKLEEIQINQIKHTKKKIADNFYER